METPMTLNHLHKELQRIKDEAEANRKLLLIEYANSNSTVNEGDIITDHIGSIKVERIGYYFNLPHSSNPAQCTYTGIELKKDLTPTKKGGIRTVYQQNLI